MIFSKFATPGTGPDFELACLDTGYGPLSDHLQVQVTKRVDPV